MKKRISTIIAVLILTLFIASVVSAAVQCDDPSCGSYNTEYLGLNGYDGGVEACEEPGHEAGCMVTLWDRYKEYICNDCHWGWEEYYDTTETHSHP